MVSPSHAAAPDADSGDLITIRDALDRDVSLPAPQRVAVLIGSFADVWCLAGGRDTLVAAADDAWTSFDLGLGSSVANLGAVKEPNLEILLASEPDLVIGSTNTQADLELESTLTAAGIPVLYFDVQNFDDYLSMLGACTELTGCRENYQRCGEALRSQIEAAKSLADGRSPRVLCIRATGKSVAVKGSTNNLLGEMLADLGCRNVADSNSGLLEDLSLEAIIAADPEFIFVVLQGADSTAAEETLQRTLLSNPAWSSLSAVKNGKLVYLDHQLYNLKPNAKWGEAYEKLAKTLYPGS
ncbi:MAG: ABC transporter substrate-binding protein [Oscillospiraceae bacterium]|nr:ABC transporter substrate-binding protein [Oscillospiraceae bacterium]